LSCCGTEKTAWRYFQAKKRRQFNGWQKATHSHAAVAVAPHRAGPANAGSVGPGIAPTISPNRFFAAGACGVDVQSGQRDLPQRSQRRSTTKRVKTPESFHGNRGQDS
jgi:hypothetical protein